MFKIGKALVGYVTVSDNFLTVLIHRVILRNESINRTLCLVQMSTPGVTTRSNMNETSQHQKCSKMWKSDNPSPS